MGCCVSKPGLVVTLPPPPVTLPPPPPPPRFFWMQYIYNKSDLLSQEGYIEERQVLESDLHKISSIRTTGVVNIRFFVCVISQSMFTPPPPPPPQHCPKNDSFIYFNWVPQTYKQTNKLTTVNNNNNNIVFCVLCVFVFSFCNFFLSNIYIWNKKKKDPSCLSLFHHKGSKKRIVYIKDS